MNDTQTDLSVLTLEDSSVPVPSQTEKNFSGINIGGNTVTQSTEHLPEEVRVIMRAIFNDARERKLTWKDIERETGKSGNFFYQVWTDRYRYPKTVTERYCNDCKRTVETKSGGVCKRCARKNITITEKAHPQAAQPIPFGRETLEALRKWKVRQDKAVKVLDDFVMISVVERITFLCDRVFKTKKIGFIIGESQNGKTQALKHYQRTHNSGQTTYLELPPSAGVQLMTRKIAEALHVSTSTCYESLLDDVIAALDPSKLLILDEAHRIFTTYQKGSVMRCLEVLRHIFDQTGCGLVFCATPQFTDNMRNGTFAQYLKQLNRRGLWELYLEDEPAPADLAAIANHYGLPAEYANHTPRKGEKDRSHWVRPARDYTVSVGDEAVNVVDLIHHLGHSHGLGMFCTRIKDAQELAEKRGERFGWEHFVKACNIAQKLATKPPTKPKHA